MMAPIRRSGLGRCASMILLSLLTSAVHSDDGLFLCTADEQLVFGCTLGNRKISICASSPLTADTDHVQYRFGTRQRLEQAYPPHPLPPAERFFLSTTGYAGGGASAIRFRIDGQDHFVFEQMRRTHFAEGEPHHAEFMAGLVVHGEGQNYTLWCDENDASLRRIAYDIFPREAYPLDRLP